MELYRRDEIVLLSLVYVVLVVYCRKIVSASRTIGTKIEGTEYVGDKMPPGDIGTRSLWHMLLSTKRCITEVEVPNFEFRLCSVPLVGIYSGTRSFRIM